ncbi:MAG: error-prone DNA polymerase [Myxococcota bacterium]
MAFAELLGRSCFSFLEGASYPHELVATSAALGHAAIALCDRDGLYGSVRMHAAARDHEHPVIVGAELTVELPGETRPYRERPLPSVAVLVQNHAGYCGLCRLLTRAHATHEKGEAGLTAEAICTEAQGLWAVVPADPRCPLPPEAWAQLADAFGERCAIATWRHLEAGDEARVHYALSLSERWNLPIVVTARALYHHPDHKRLADVVHCIRLTTTLAEAGTSLPGNAQAHLQSEAELKALFPKHPEWIERTAEIAVACTFSLDELHYHFPCEYGAAELTPVENLRAEVERGCHERYPEGTPVDVRAQLDKELELIDRLDVAPYFLSVKQVVEIARERGILCQGRGSAANSAVCFVLGITSVDPVRSALLFERFMSDARHEPPDIDVDFEHERREEVIQEIYRRYGRDRAAMVSVVICYRGKSSLREVGKVFGLADEQLDRLSSIATYFSAGPDADDAALDKRGLDASDRGLRQVVRLAEQLAGTPRHLSIHTGGFVLSSEPLFTVAPVEPGRMADRTVIPWDKDDIETLGFFKVDVLGLGMLTAIRKALQMVHHRHADPLDFDPIAELGRIPAEDPTVYDLCCEADTVGIFQIESRAQMAMLPLLRPREFYDLVVEVGIVRPGPIQGGMVHPYLRRRTGEEAITYPHTCLRPILERTLGVPLFQEQVMALAIAGADYSPGEADQLRRDMAAWRKNGKLEQHRIRLLKGFRQKGIPDDFAHRLFQQIQGFGEYGFPESHAASFALLVYASAWIKVYHPAAFACALINSQPLGFYSPATIVKDAQKRGIEVRPVSVAESQWDCTLEYDGALDETPALRLGFRLVRGLNRDHVDQLLARRAQRGFSDIEDLVHRCSMHRDELERLAEAGALAPLNGSRREAMWSLAAPRESEGLFAAHPIEPATPAGLAPLHPQEQLSLDYNTTGISIDDHPMRHIRPHLEKRTDLRGARRLRYARDQRTWDPGTRVSVAGIVLTRQRPQTASGIVFITLEDETGTMNLVLYNHIFERYELVARHAHLMLAQGPIDRRGPVVHIRVDHMERLEMPTLNPTPTSLRVRSRDFH